MSCRTPGPKPGAAATSATLAVPGAVVCGADIRLVQKAFLFYLFVVFDGTGTAVVRLSL